jgi:hypothetical protein
MELTFQEEKVFRLFIVIFKKYSLQSLKNWKIINLIIFKRLCESFDNLKRVCPNLL